MSKTWKLLLALLVATGMLVACGGDDDDDGGGNASEEADADADTEVDLEDVGDLPFASEECQEAYAGFLGAAGGAGAALTGQGDELEESLDQLEAFAGSAPDEIKDDFALVVEAYAEFVEVFADLDFDPTSGEAPDAETMAALEEIGEKFEDADLQAASERISAWFEENCGGVDRNDTQGGG